MAGVATLVNPIDLSLRQLRWLLRARGVSHYGAIEKKDLSDLVSASGVVTSVRKFDFTGNLSLVDLSHFLKIII